tara:strand:- start:5558 stop:5812 length:255 start_codon:yes stop_codon:yes gene_type:complete
MDFYQYSFYAAADFVLSLELIAFFLLRDFVLRIILQQGQRIFGVSNQISHQLHLFNPNWYFCEFGIFTTLCCAQIPLHDAPIIK